MTSFLEIIHFNESIFGSNPRKMVLQFGTEINAAISDTLMTIWYDGGEPPRSNPQDIGGGNPSSSSLRNKESRNKMKTKLRLNYANFMKKNSDESNKLSNLGAKSINRINETYEHYVFLINNYYTIPESIREQKQTSQSKSRNLKRVSGSKNTQEVTNKKEI